MRIAVLAALLASTCFTPPKPGQGSDPIGFPPDDAGATFDEVESGMGPPETDCDIAAEHLEDLECGAAEGHAAWLVRCAKLPTAALTCVLSTDVCATARACLEAP